MFLPLLGQQEGEDGQGVYSLHHEALPAANLPNSDDRTVIRIKNMLFIAICTFRLSNSIDLFSTVQQFVT